jgi:hypothetical protein
MNYCVVTTINKPTKAIESLYKIFGENLIIVGDKKTPEDWNYKELPVLMECDRPYAPNNHYARKNIGYLLAIKNKASLIYDTDDDNIPHDSWQIRTQQVDADESIGDGWYNVYDLLSPDTIWPRGFSLRRLKEHPSCGKRKFRISSIQQGLADGEPDVDAIWRLVLHKSHYFKHKKSIYLNKWSWCPFNSQSTWWFPKAYPLMYLPIYASFRMCDIWRSFIAQRCIWEIGEGVTFHSPSEVFQDRNEHDLMNDFKDEIPGYLHNDEIVEILSNLNLKSGEDYICENLLTCYQALVDKKILPYLEIESVMAWIKDYGDVTKNI